MRLLLVEDDADTAWALGRLLTHAGHEVTLASGASEALRRATDHPPEVIVSDISLPGMSGWDLARALRGDPRCREVALIALSGFAGDADRARGLAAGFDEYLVKPVSGRDLERAIDQACRKRRASEPGSAREGTTREDTEEV